MEQSDDGYLRDLEIALMDAIRTIFEIMVAKKIAAPEVIDKMLAAQSGAYPLETMSKAIFVMDTIRKLLTDPQRAGREKIWKLLEEPPAGSA